MAELLVPNMDFSSLAQLPAIYKKNNNEMKLAELGRGLADGSVNYKQAAAHTAGMGDITHTLQFLALAEQQKKQGLEQAAAADFSKGIGGLYGAQPSAAPPTANPTPVPGAPVRVPAAAPPMAMDRAPVQSSSKVWGDDEAEAAGLYEPKPTRLAALAPQAPAVARPAPAAPAQPVMAQTAPASPAASPAGQPGAQHVPILLQALSNPNLPAGQKETAKLLLTEAFKNMKEPEKIQTLRAMQADPSLLELEKQLKAAGKTEINIDQKGEGEFEKEMSKGQAKRWNGYIAEGNAAERKLVDINTMREIHQRIGSQGAAANVKEIVGPYAEALGVNINGLSDIQAYSQVIQRLAPQQRAEGSGSTSDIEFKGFIKSLPTLSQHPAAREVGLNTMEALTRDDIARGEIASRLATKEITRKDAEKALRALPDPMQGFVEWRKANPGVYGQALKGEAAGPASVAGSPAAAKAPIKVTSPAEARKLPSGTQIILPDGTPGRVP